MKNTTDGHVGWTHISIRNCLSTMASEDYDGVEVV